MNIIPSFWQAVSAGDQAKIQQLLVERPDLLLEKHDSGHNVVRLACDSGQLDLARWLASRGAPVTVFESVVLGDRDIVQSAVDSDPAILAKLSHDGWFLLHLAGFAGHSPIVELLIKAGASALSTSQNAMANTPLHAAIAGACDPRCIELLIEFEPRAVQITAAGGVTALHLAASRGADAIVDLLLERGADNSRRLDDDQSPADLARARGFIGLADRLADL